MGVQHLWIGVVRMMFPFFAGLLLYRSGFGIRIPAAYLICSFVAGSIVLPDIPFNGWYEVASIIIASLDCMMGGGGYHQRSLGTDL